MVPLLL